MFAAERATWVLQRFAMNCNWLTMLNQVATMVLRSPWKLNEEAERELVIG
jgi:hypothetical protein